MPRTNWVDRVTSIVFVQVHVHVKPITNSQCYVQMTLRGGYYNHVLRQVICVYNKVINDMRLCCPSIRQSFHWWTDNQYLEMGGPAQCLLICNVVCISEMFYVKGAWMKARINRENWARIIYMVLSGLIHSRCRTCYECSSYHNVLIIITFIKQVSVQLHSGTGKTVWYRYWINKKINIYRYHLNRSRSY